MKIVTISIYVNVVISLVLFVFIIRARIDNSEASYAGNTNTVPTDGQKHSASELTLPRGASSKSPIRSDTRGESKGSKRVVAPKEFLQHSYFRLSPESHPRYAKALDLELEAFQQLNGIFLQLVDATIELESNQVREQVDNSGTSFFEIDTSQNQYQVLRESAEKRFTEESPIDPSIFIESLDYTSFAKSLNGYRFYVERDQNNKTIEINVKYVSPEGEMMNLNNYKLSMETHKVLGFPHLISPRFAHLIPSMIEKDE